MGCRQAAYRRRTLRRGTKGQGEQSGPRPPPPRASGVAVGPLCALFFFFLYIICLQDRAKGLDKGVYSTVHRISFGEVDMGRGT